VVELGRLGHRVFPAAQGRDVLPGELAQAGDVFVGRPLDQHRDDAEFEDEAGFGDVDGGDGGELDEVGEAGAEAFGGGGGDEGSAAGADADLDEAAGFEDAEGFADGDAADAHAFAEFAFGGEAVAGAQPVGPDQGFDLVDDRLGHAVGGDGGEHAVPTCLRARLTHGHRAITSPFVPAQVGGPAEALRIVGQSTIPHCSSPR